MKKVLVCGAGGFIGSHLVKSLRAQGHYVVGADLRFPLFGETQCNEFYQYDLRNQRKVTKLITNDIDEIYQLAADMGGAEYIFSGHNDAEILHNSALINLNILHEMTFKRCKKIFYTSSACIYPAHNQLDPDNPNCEESSAYPADPDSEYGWEKLFSERLYASFAKNHGLHVRIARLHNVFGTESAWRGGREKAPAALCRKVAESQDGTVQVWGPGTQTRSFLWIDECIEGIHRLMASDYTQPLNIGSDRMIAINDLAHLIGKVVNRPVQVINIPGPMGVMGRNSSNALIESVLGWKPQDRLEHGLVELYHWIQQQLNK
jgi:nucleoside-diphosphate-sugar epimerase